MKKRLLATLAIVVVFFAGALALAVVFGGPSAPSAIASANNPFEAADFSGLPSSVLTLPGMERAWPFAVMTSRIRRGVRYCYMGPPQTAEACI